MTPTPLQLPLQFIEAGAAASAASEAIRSLTAAITKPAPGPPVRGPLVVQTAPAAGLATVLHNAAQELWDASTQDDAAQMWEEARAIASRILASCPV